MTLSVKVTVQRTADALVGEGSARTIEETVGGVTSLTTVTELLADEVAVQLRQTATTLYVYVPSATPESLQLVDDVSELAEVPHAALGVEPRYRKTKYPPTAPALGAETPVQLTDTVPEPAVLEPVTAVGTARAPTAAVALPPPLVDQ